MRVYLTEIVKMIDSMSTAVEQVLASSVLKGMPALPDVVITDLREKITQYRGIIQQLVVPRQEEEVQLDSVSSDSTPALFLVKRVIPLSGNSLLHTSRLNLYITLAGLAEGCLSCSSSKTAQKMTITQVWTTQTHLKQHLTTEEFSSYQSYLEEHQLLEELTIQRVRSL